jgi:hypothetical protein
MTARPRRGRTGRAADALNPQRRCATATTSVAPLGFDWSRPVFRGLSPTAMHIESLRDSGTRPRPRPRINHRPQRREGSGSMIQRPTNYRRRPSPAGTNLNSRGCKPTGGRPMTARPRRGRTGRAADALNPSGVLSLPRYRSQPRWGCGIWRLPTQGSSSLATLGFRAESRWDSPTARRRGRMVKRNHLQPQSIPKGLRL